MTTMTKSKQKSKRPSPAKRALTARVDELSKQIDAKRIELEKLQKAGKIEQTELPKEALYRLERQRWCVANPFLTYWHSSRAIGGYPSKVQFCGPDAFPWRVRQYCHPEYRSEELQITFRQAQVAYGASLGLPNIEIAGALKLKVQTVKAIVGSLYRKIGIAEGESNARAA